MAALDTEASPTMHALIGLPGGMEWVILLVVVVLLFGGTRLAGIGKGTGRAIREFKEETRGLGDARKKDDLEPPAADDEPTGEGRDEPRA